MNARASSIAARGLALTLLLGTVAAQGMSWPDVWLRPDQQAQRILESGNAAAAAALFQDPRRRAYAELESKRYDDAAKRLEPFKDAPSQYNRGNALARAGQLPAALAAYDAALRAADADSVVARDAKHNRDLVARQLEKQQHSPPQQSQDHSQQQQSQQQAGNGNAGNAGESAHEADAQQRDGRRTEAPAPDKEQRNAQQAAAQRAESEQARRDAAAAIAQSASQPAAPQHPSSARAQSALQGSEPAAPRVDVPADALRPESEQTMALDQWLRAMPDDPGGLLRRKFMIEHMMKQRQIQP
jgi:Ca-activated chloride channel family protein